MAEPKFEFCSPEWVAYAREYLRRQAADADLTGVEATFNEVFTDAPAHLAPDAEGCIGWYLRVAHGAVEVERGILAAADLRITADYATVLPLARMVFDGNADLAAEAGRRVAQATAAGKMRREGDAAALAGVTFMAQFHDVMARRTA